MTLLREVVEGEVPVKPEDGWNVGSLAHLGVLLSCEGFSARFDLHNLNALFDFAEAGEVGDIKDSEGRIIEVRPEADGIVLVRQDDKMYPHGVVLDLETLAELGIEQHELEDELDAEDENDPDSEFDDLNDDDTIVSEGVKRAFRRSGKKIKRGFRVTSGFRKGRVVATAAGAFKPRAKASTRMKLKIASRKKKIVRILKSKRTRKLPTSKRLVRLNKKKK